MDKITGKLTGVAGISGTLSSSGGISGEIGTPEEAPLDPYVGDYNVTPQLYEETLLTKGCRMMDNVTVRGIPVVATSNIYGGKTVVIG